MVFSSLSESSEYRADDDDAMTKTAPTLFRWRYVKSKKTARYDLLARRLFIGLQVHSVEH